MQSQTPDAEGKVGLGFPNSSNPYGYLASRYETSIKTPYDILNRDNTYQNLDDSLKRKVGDVLYTEYPLNSYRPLPGLTSLSVDATQVFTNAAKASIKLFSMSQVDLVMNSMLKLNGQYVMMWGYSSITQDFIKENIYKDGKFHLKLKISSIELKKLSQIDSSRKVFKILDQEVKEHIHSLQILIN